MAAYTFEIVREGQAPVTADVPGLSEEHPVWCQVEVLALRIDNGDGAFICVKNLKGQCVIRAGVSTALASIQECPYQSCSLKTVLQRRQSSNHLKADFEFSYIPCPRRGNYSWKSRSGLSGPNAF